MKIRDPHVVLKAFVARYPTQTAAAAALGISIQHLGDILRRQRRLTDAMCEKLGLERIVIERKAS